MQNLLKGKSQTQNYPAA